LKTLKQDSNPKDLTFGQKKLIQKIERVILYTKGMSILEIDLVSFLGLIKFYGKRFTTKPTEVTNDSSNNIFNRVSYFYQGH
jgi:hypothetical protein